MPSLLEPFAYFLFHIVVWASLLVGKIIYPPMKFPDLKKIGKVLPISAVFIIWDIFVTNRWWYFSDQYTLFKIGVLPVEEILFFISIPIALLVITENLKTLPFFNQKIKISVQMAASIRFIFLLGFFVFLAKGWEYTAMISALVSIFTYKHNLENKVFLTGLGLTFICTFFFNLYLTALPIVTYNAIYKSSWQILSIPIEDFFYGAIFYQLVFSRYYENSSFYQTT